MPNLLPRVVTLSVGGGSLIISVASSDDVNAIVDCTNEAFMADIFFKKPEYHLRFTPDDVRSMIESEDSVFLVARIPVCDEVTPQIKDKSDFKSSANICASLFLQWSYLRDGECAEIVGKFSAVSVRKQYERKGLGRAIVENAENFLLHLAAGLAIVDGNSSSAELPASEELRTQLIDKSNISVRIEMGVINLRTDLFPWYEKQGYNIVGEIRPNDAELLRIIRDDMVSDVCCIKMQKTII